MKSIIVRSASSPIELQLLELSSSRRETQTRRRREKQQRAAESSREKQQREAGKVPLLLPTPPRSSGRGDRCSQLQNQLPELSRVGTATPLYYSRADS